MTVFQDLVKVYDDNQDMIGKFEQDQFKNDYTLLPASHVSVRVQIEVTLNKDGQFYTARQLDKPGETTVIPATIHSANRASNIAAHPLQDKIKYVAGDYSEYATNDKKAKAYHEDYQDIFRQWVQSKFSNARLIAIEKYQEKNSLIKDLISAGVVTLDSGKLTSKDRDAYVRFDVYDDNPESIWRDTEMYQSWTKFYGQLLKEKTPLNIDYLTGKLVPTTKLIEKNINPATSGAKLISANDSSNFTYRGMFLGDDFYSIGYLESQKMTHALKWLIQRQALKSDSRVYLFWSEGNSNDSVAQTAKSLTSGITDWQTQKYQLLSQSKGQGDTGQQISHAYNSRLLGLTSDIEYGKLVHIIFLDAATTGRMATVYYNFMDTKIFKENIEHWAKNCGVIINDGGGQHIHMPTINQLISSAYKVGRGGQRYETLKKHALGEMIVAITTGQSISRDLLTVIQHRLAKPQGYDALHQWYNDLYNFAAAFNYNQKGGKKNMALNIDNHDRSYLFGRLLALANDMEERVLYQRQSANSNVSSRLTTALRFMTNFSNQPATTWKRINESIVQSYFGSLSAGSQHYYLGQVTDILDLLEDHGMTDEPLTPQYLTGFASQYVYNHKKQDKKTSLQTEA